MLTAVILICLAGTEASACTTATALDVIRLPVESAMPFACLRDAQAYLAGSEIGRDLGQALVKVACIREGERR